MAFKEVEVVKGLPQDSKPNNNSMIMGGREREPQGVPLMQILGKTVAEFAYLPKGRQVDDFPDTHAYFKSEDTLVMLRRRRPIIHSPVYQSREGVHDGYFVEVFDIGKDGRPRNGFSNPVSFEGIPEGLFQGIEVTDEPGDSYYGSLWLTPTSFPAIIREKLGEKMSNQPRVLPSPGDENKGVLGQLFAQKQLEGLGQVKNEEEGRSVRQEITKKYFHENSVQGLNKEVGNSHFVITEDKNSQLAQASRELGVETHVVKMNETWDAGGGVNPVNDLRDDSGKRPMLISLDTPSFIGKERRGLPRDPIYVARAQVIDYAKRGPLASDPLDNPLFSFIEWQGKTAEPDAARYQNGWYFLRGNEPETAKKLIMKVGIDYLLTSKVREIAKN